MLYDLENPMIDLREDDEYEVSEYLESLFKDRIEQKDSDNLYYKYCILICWGLL